MLDPEGIYNASSFDEYALSAITEHRDYNVMAGGYDAGMMLSFQTDMISEDFIDYVNDYVRYAEKKGAKVYLGFCR